MAYVKVKYLYEREEYNELVDIAYHYMTAFIRDLPEMIMLRDEFENATGVKEHYQIVNYIIDRL
jgi:hypothetical protein